MALNTSYYEFSMSDVDDRQLVTSAFLDEADKAKIVFKAPDSVRDLKVLEDPSDPGVFSMEASVYGVSWRVTYYPADIYWNPLDDNNPTVWFGIGYPIPPEDLLPEEKGETCYEVSPVIPVALAKVVATEIRRRYPES